MQTKNIFFTALVVWGLNAPVPADTLVIQAVDQTSTIARPNKGESMAQVETAYGKPETRVAAVGQPPITRWVYADFTVYFEGESVIRAVANR